MRSSVIMRTLSDSPSFSKGVGLSDEGPIAGAVCSRLRGGNDVGSIAWIWGAGFDVSSVINLGFSNFSDT